MQSTFRSAHSGQAAGAPALESTKRLADSIRVENVPLMHCWVLDPLGTGDGTTSTFNAVEKAWKASDEASMAAESVASIIELAWQRLDRKPSDKNAMVALLGAIRQIKQVSNLAARSCLICETILNASGDVEASMGEVAP